MGLLKSIPKADAGVRERLIPIPGTPPDLLNPPKGCPFSPRCSFAMNICNSCQPGYYAISEGHRATCWLLDERAPKNEGYCSMKGGVGANGK